MNERDRVVLFLQRSSREWKTRAEHSHSEEFRLMALARADALDCAAEAIIDGIHYIPAWADE